MSILLENLNILNFINNWIILLISLTLVAVHTYSLTVISEPYLLHFLDMNFIKLHEIQ